MEVQAIAHSYWRLVKNGKRTFESLKGVSAKSGYPSMQEQVRYLAKTDVANGVITAEEYEQYIGEAYIAE